jgi:glycosyltransferase involved in cell wall biosynthesis
MRIALLTDGIYPYVIGGMQKHSYYLALYLAKNQIYVDLYHTSEDSEQAEQLACYTAKDKKFISSIFTPFPSLKKIPGHYIRESYSYSNLLFQKIILKKDTYDFIYVQGLCGMYLLEHKNQVPCPVGVNFHGLEMFQKAPSLKTKLAQYFFKRPVLKSLKASDVVFSLGGKLTDLLISKGISQEKISQISIGIDPSWIKEQPCIFHPTKRFVFIGRYERRKGIEELFAAIQGLNEEKFTLSVIGAIPEDKKLIDQRIEYFGNISDPEGIKAILLEADVLVCPSHSEGMPTVILEAMAMGLAIIATDVGAVTELVDEHNGKIVLAGDVEGLKSAISLFMSLPEPKLLEMKKKSILKIKDRFLWENVISLTISEMRRVIRARS